MAGPLVFVFPGFLGTTINELVTDTITRVLWVNYSHLATGGGEKLRLNAAGTGPFQNNLAGRLVLGGPVAEYYDPLVRALEDDFEPVTVSYDWRRRMVEQAQLAWNLIKTRAGQNPFYMVGHSMGGLIARLVWRAAKAENREAQILRTVTLGTPHYGAYDSVWAFAHLNETYRQLLQLIYGIAISLLGPGSLGLDYLFDAGPISALDRIVASWPGLYDLMPSQTEPGHFAYDPLRGEIYDIARWQNLNVSMSAGHLAEANGVTHTALQNAIPPAAQLVSVYGTGLYSPKSIRTPTVRLGTRAGYNMGDGDGRVIVESARLSANTLQVTGIDHAELPRHPVVLAQLPDLLVEVAPLPRPAISGNPGYIPPPAPLPEPVPPTTIPFDGGGTTAPFEGWLPSIHDC